jgi:hypothetical protein
VMADDNGTDKQKLLPADYCQQVQDHPADGDDPNQSNATSPRVSRAANVHQQPPSTYYATTAPGGRIVYYQAAAYPARPPPCCGEHGNTGHCVPLPVGGGAQVVGGAGQQYIVCNDPACRGQCRGFVVPAATASSYRNSQSSEGNVKYTKNLYWVHIVIFG